jgi:ABC-type uncharacterized transport system YnjBCD substrate-binding protein
VPIFKRDGTFIRTIHKLYKYFNNAGSVLERERRQPSSVRSPENTGAAKKSAVNQQRRLQHNWVYQTIGATNTEK